MSPTLKPQPDCCGWRRGSNLMTSHFVRLCQCLQTFNSLSGPARKQFRDFQWFVLTVWLNPPLAERSSFLFFASPMLPHCLVRVVCMYTANPQDVSLPLKQPRSLTWMHGDLQEAEFKTVSSSLPPDPMFGVGACICNIARPRLE